MSCLTEKCQSFKYPINLYPRKRKPGRVISLKSSSIDVGYLSKDNGQRLTSNIKNRVDIPK
jgi:hypothetical protein